MAIYGFQVSVHALPAGAADGKPIVLSGRSLATLAISPQQVSTPFALSFEEVAERLESIPRLFFEPDGSFVWASSQQEPQRWQVDGNLFDRDGRLLFVDLKGTCASEQFDRLLAALGWPGTPLMFQLTREAVWLREEAFREVCTLPSVVQRESLRN